MMGLERGTVELEPHQEVWTERYTTEVQRLHDIVGNRVVEFEHIGSTAIEGLPAKPIIDILALVVDITDANALSPVLEDCGYERRPDDIEDRLFFAKGPRTNRTVYLSLTERGSDFHRETIAFREYLRAHPDAADEYASVKQRLAERYPEDRDAFTATKGDFIEDILDEAMSE